MQLNGMQKTVKLKHSIITVKMNNKMIKIRINKLFSFEKLLYRPEINGIVIIQSISFLRVKISKTMSK